MKNIYSVGICIGLITFIVNISSQAFAQPTLDMVEISRIARGYTVFLTVKHVDANNPNNVCPQVFGGTAFLINSSGYALTANHNLRPHDDCTAGGYTQLKIEGRIGYQQTATLLPAALVHSNDISDTALLKFAERAGGYEGAPFCNRQEPVAGERLVAVGFPRGGGSRHWM